MAGREIVNQNPMRREDTSYRDALAKQRAEGVKAIIQKNDPDYKPGIFADSVTWGMQRPVMGAVAAVSPWMYPGTSMSERYQGGSDAYKEALEKQIAETHPASTLAQSILGGTVTGGPAGSFLKQALFDAGGGAVQSFGADEGWDQILQSALLNAGFGGAFNASGKGVGKLREIDDAYTDMTRGYK